MANDMGFNWGAALANANYDGGLSTGAYAPGGGASGSYTGNMPNTPGEYWSSPAAGAYVNMYEQMGGGGRGGNQTAGAAAGAQPPQFFGGAMGGGFGMAPVFGGGGGFAPTAQQRAAMAALANDYSSKYNEARAANLARYGEGKTGWTDLRSRVMGYLDNLSNQGANDIEDQYTSLDRKKMLELNARGLGNSTNLTSSMTATAGEKSRALANLNDMLMRERAGYDTQSTGNLLNFIERRQDTYPDLNQMIQLAQLSGQYGGYDMTGLGGAAGGGRVTPSSVGSYSDLMARQNRGVRPGEWGPGSIPNYSQLMLGTY